LQLSISALNAAQVPWHLAHAASSLAGVKAAVKAGLGVTARPVEMMSPELRVPGKSDGLPGLPRGDDIFAKRPGLFEQHQRNGFTLRQYVIRGAVPLGVTARPVEMMSPELRVPGKSDGLPGLPDTHYVMIIRLYETRELSPPSGVYSVSVLHGLWSLARD
jgi:hypothetical protein